MDDSIQEMEGEDSEVKPSSPSNRPPTGGQESPPAPVGRRDKYEAEKQGKAGLINEKVHEQVGEYADEKFE